MNDYQRVKLSEETPLPTKQDPQKACPDIYSKLFWIFLAIIVLGAFCQK